MTTIPFIQPADLTLLREAAARADIAMRDAEILKLRAYVRYGLGEHDSFDLATGAITRAVPVDLPANGDG